MYHLNNQIPAPYELNQPQPMTSMQQPQAFAKGGRAKGRMILAHFSPHELGILDHLQGKTERCPKSGLRSYIHLEELLKNPHIVENVHHHAREHHATGGSTYGVPELEHLAAGGRHGDSEMALIGPHTHHVFNQLAGGGTTNPHTGHPEYWSLKGALGGLWKGIKGVGSGVWNGIKGIGRAAAPALMPMAQEALGNRFGERGKMAAGFLPGLANHAFGSGEQNPMHQALGEGIGKAAQAYHGGMGAQQALGQGLEHTGNRFGGSGLGSAMQGAGSALNKGHGFGQALRQGAQQGFNTMGGLSGIGDMAKNIIASRGAPGGMRQALGTQANRFMHNVMPNANQMSNLEGFEALPYHEG